MAAECTRQVTRWARLATEGTKHSCKREGAARFKLWLKSNLPHSQFWGGVFLRSCTDLSRDIISYLSPTVSLPASLGSAVAVGRVAMQTFARIAVMRHIHRLSQTPQVHPFSYKHIKLILLCGRISIPFWVNTPFSLSIHLRMNI